MTLSEIIEREILNLRHLFDCPFLNIVSVSAVNEVLVFKLIFTVNNLKCGYKSNSVNRKFAENLFCRLLCFKMHTVFYGSRIIRNGFHNGVVTALILSVTEYQCFNGSFTFT